MRGEAGLTFSYPFLFFSLFPPISSRNRWDDGLILPHETRTVLGLTLGVVTKAWKPLAHLSTAGAGEGGMKGVGNFGVFRM